MNIRDLQYLIAVADHCHFGLAADACFVSQPALSMQIKKLENALGVQLIERTSRSASLTEAGSIITQHAREILSSVETIKAYAKQSSDPYSGELHLGVIPTLGPYLLPLIIKDLSTRYPKLTIYLYEEQTARLTEKLKQGKLDAALLALPLTNDDFNFSALFQEEFMLAISSDNPLSTRKRLKLSDLENKTLLLLEDGHCLRDMALDLCYKTNASESKRFRASSLETLRHMVASNAGITLIPSLASKPNDGVQYLPFCHPKPSRTIGLVSRPSSAKRILLENLVTEIKKLMYKNKLIDVIN